MRELCLKYERIDPVTELIPVRPVVHYMMGGVHTDIDGATPLAGLYAAGETACVSINGANRLGSNSLPECLVFGARAGRAAAAYAASAGPPPASIAAQAADEVRRLERLLGTPPGDDAVAPIRTEMQTAMEDAAGIYRTGPEMAAGVDLLKGLQERALRVGIWDTSRTFNTELVAALELANLLDVAECMLASGLRREESRGAHQRTDFPARDDERFLIHQMVERDPDGSPQVVRAAGDDHPLAPGRADLREVAMADSITLRVTRWRPDKNTPPGFGGLRRPAAQGVDGPRRPQLHQGRARPDPRLPLVVPDGDLRQLRHERQRRAAAVVWRVPDRLRTRSRSRWSRWPTSPSPATWSSTCPTSWRSSPG